MHSILLFLLIAATAGAADTGYIAKMIACEEKEEAMVSDTYSAFLTLIEEREIPKGTLRFPVRLTEKRADGFIISRGYYVTPNELRGFEIFVPKDCVVEKDGVLVSTAVLIVASQDSKQGFTLLVLKKEPNNSVQRTSAKPPSLT